MTPPSPAGRGPAAFPKIPLPSPLDRHGGLIARYARELSARSTLDFEDAFQELALAAWRALPMFDPSRGFTEGTFVVRCLFNASFHILKRENRSSRRANLFTDSLDSSPPDSDLTLGESLPFLDPSCVSPEDRFVLESALRLLTPRESAAVFLLLLGYNQVEIGAVFNKSRSWFNFILRKLREITRDRPHNRSSPP